MNCRKCRRTCCMNNNSNYLNKEMLENECETCKNLYPTNGYNENCSCGFEEDEVIDVFPRNPVLAQSYVPVQYINKTFKPCVGLDNGTIFPELVSPYNPGDSMKDIEYLRRTNPIGEGCNDGR